MKLRTREEIQTHEKLKRKFGLFLILATLIFMGFSIKAILNFIPEEKKTVKYFILNSFPYQSFYEYKVEGKDTIPHGHSFTKKDGRVEIIGSYKDGKKHGRFEVFNTQNQITSIINYRNDILEDTTFFFSGPNQVGSYKIYSNNKLIKEVHLNDQKEDFITFFLRNDTITNLTMTFVSASDHKSTLSLKPDSTYEYKSPTYNKVGKFSFKYPYKIKLDSLSYFISMLRENRIMLITFESKIGLPEKFDGYNQSLINQ